MTKPRTLARVGLGGVALAESMAAWSRWERRRDLFLAAAARARETRRRLIVVLPDKEGPIARALRVYEFGRHYPEVFLASPSPVVRARDLQRAPLADVPGDSAVLYVAEVLEYVSDLRAVMEELMLDLMYQLPESAKGGDYVIDEDAVKSRPTLESLRIHRKESAA